MKDAVEAGAQETAEYAEKECEVCMNAAERMFRECLGGRLHQKAR